MNYEEMSDFEVNGYVSMHMHGFSWIEFVDGCASHVKCGNECSPGFAMIEVYDYCNNPSDAWPIITSNSIAIFETAVAGGDVRWVATTNLDKSWLGYGAEGFDCYHNNPLRAAMIVFLMMQEKAL